jgi:predicted small lipoprotein YifL
MAALMRRMVAIAVLLATGGPLAGCGKGGPVTVTTPAHSATKATTPATHPGGAPTAPQTGATPTKAKAQAQAFARAVNLQAADVPGFHVSAEHQHEPETSAEKRLKPELRRCFASAGETKALVESSSGKFERSAGIASQSVNSEVTIGPASLTAKELGAIRGGHLPACLSHYFELLLKSQNLHGASVGPVSSKEGSPPARGMTGSFGLRFTATIALRGVHVPFYVDILGFADGPAEVTLSTFGLPQPFPATLEEQLFSLLLERARAHKL